MSREGEKISFSEGGGGINIVFGPKYRPLLPGDEYSGESRLPGSEYTGESIKNSNNSSNILKNLKSFLGVSNGTRRRCSMKKKPE
jgi:hypothetical protein